MAFVSVGSVITTLVFTLGPILATVWRESLERVEGEAKKIEEDMKGREQKPKEDLNGPRHAANFCRPVTGA